MILDTHRTRERSDFHYEDNVTVLSDGNSVRSDIPTFTSFQRMEDRVNRKKNGHYSPSPVRSISIKSALPPITHGWVPDGRTFVADNHPFPIYVDDVLGLSPDVPDAIWEDLCVGAFNSFSTQIPTEVSFGNFLWELREIAALLPQLSDSLLGSAAGTHLNWQFGWKPFLSDLVKLGSVLNTTNQKIQHLMDTYGKRTQLGIYKKAVVDTGRILIPQWVQSGGNPFCYLAPSYHYADFRAGATLYHALRDLNSAYGTFRGCISALGLNNPVKAVWDAIPYSFVAGWFTRVGTHLDKLAVNPFKGAWDVSNVSFSMSERIVLQAETRLGSIPGFGSAWGFVEVRRYTRLDGFPIGVNSFNLFDLNPSQQSLMASLIVGMR